MANEKGFEDMIKEKYRAYENGFKDIEKAKELFLEAWESWKKFGMLLGRESVIFDLIYFKAIRILSVVKEYNLCKEAKDFGIEHLIQLAEDILINNWNKPLTNMERQAYQ